MWLYVSMPHATFALEVQDGDLGRVTDAPPIARWTVGQLASHVVRYYIRKQARLQLFKEG